jgi:uncharacterized membrane protein
MTTPTSAPEGISRPDRLIAFSDGVVAIAITLLILPLAEIEPEVRDVWATLAVNQFALLAFGLSFAVIANYWFGHHTLFELVERQDRALARINMVWLACIVFIPFLTALLDDTEDGYTTFYIATLTAASVLNVLLTRHLATHPELVRPGSVPELRQYLVTGWAVVGALVIALLVSFASQRGGLYALLLLIPAQVLAGRRSRRSAETP